MQIKVSLPKELLAAIDAGRGDVSRSMFIRRAVEALPRADGKSEYLPLTPSLVEEPKPSVYADRVADSKRSPMPKREIRAPREETELPKIARRHWA